MASSSTAGLGPRIRQARLDAGLRQADLAERAGMADATLSRIERNRLVPSVALAKRLADALGVPVDSLLNASTKPTKQRSLRPSEARLLAAVRDLDDAVVDDLVRGLRLIMAAAVRVHAGRGLDARRGSSPRRRRV